MRKTVTMPESTVEAVREAAREGESFSATLVRLVEERTHLPAGKAPSYSGMLDGPGDMGRRAEEYLRQVFAGR